MKSQNFMMEDTLSWLLETRITRGALPGSTRPGGIDQR